jgi:transcriptional regulator with XRE-family HTH domain
VAIGRGQVLKLLRHQTKSTQRALAKKAGVSLATVQRAEQDNSQVEDETWERIAAAFDLTLRKIDSIGRLSAEMLDVVRAETNLEIHARVWPYGEPPNDKIEPSPSVQGPLQKSPPDDDSVMSRRLTEDERTMLDLPDRGLLISAATLAWQLLKRPQDREAFALAIVDLARRMASGVPSTGTEGKGDE